MPRPTSNGHCHERNDFDEERQLHVVWMDAQFVFIDKQTETSLAVKKCPCRALSEPMASDEQLISHLFFLINDAVRNDWFQRVAVKRITSPQLSTFSSLAWREESLGQIRERMLDCYGGSLLTHTSPSNAWRWWKVRVFLLGGCLSSLSDTLWEYRSSRW